MMMWPLIALMVSVAMCGSLSAAAQGDYVIHNARIYTVNAEQPTAQAPAVRGDRILMVGSTLLRSAPFAAFQENEFGSIESGKRADFVVLSRDIMVTAPQQEVLDARIVATYLDGTSIHVTSEWEGKAGR